MKATIFYGGMTVIYEGEAVDVIKAVEAFFEDGEGEDSETARPCELCRYEKTPGDMQPCDECTPATRKFEPKPEGGKYKPNYRVHPAETIRERIDAMGGIGWRTADDLTAIFGGTSSFWRNLWKNYKEAK